MPNLSHDSKSNRIGSRDPIQKVRHSHILSVGNLWSERVSINLP